MQNNAFLQSLFRKKLIETSEAIDHGHVDGSHPTSQLKRSLSVWDLTSLGVAAVIGAGIFSTVGTASFHGGPAVVWLFVITAVVCGISTACYAEFASKVPAAGSAYTYAYVSLGELIAWIIGWDLIMEYAIGNIAVAISWSSYFSRLLGTYGIHIPRFLTTDYVSAYRGFQQVTALTAGGQSLPDALAHVDAATASAYQAWSLAPKLAGVPFICNLPALGIVIAVTYVAYIGIREAKWTANAMVALKILVILMIIFVGAAYVHPENWVPFAPNGVGGVFKGVSAVFFAYIGFDAISTTAEECRNPQRDLPRAMFYSLGICTLLYSGIALVITGIVNYRNLAVADPLAFVFGASGANLPWMSAIVAVSAVVAMTSVLLVFQLGQPRIWMAMSRDRLLPKIFASIHPRYKTPWFSTLLTGVLVAIPALFMNMTEVTDLTSIGTLFAFLLVCGGTIRLHEDRRKLQALGAPAKPGARRAFHVPIIGSRVLMPLGFALAAGAVWYFNRDGFLALLDFGLPWDLLKEKLPLYGYLVGSVALLGGCLTWNLSLIPCLGLLSCGYLMTELGWTNWARFLIWLGIGLVIYFTYGRVRSALHEGASAGGVRR